MIARIVTFSVERRWLVLLLTAADKIEEALGAAQVGTVFHTRPERSLSAWKFWALYAADAEGVLRLDAGAVDAVTRGGTSLLAVGITGIEGEFHAGDIVEILGPDSEAVGRGEPRAGGRRVHVGEDLAVLLAALRVVGGEVLEPGPGLVLALLQARAVTNVWKDALVGATPTRPFHFGSVSSSTDVGRSASGTFSSL